jgi:diguanylate cyclase (GGDEF)-like protein
MKIYKYIRQKPFSINYKDNYTILELASLFLKTNNDSAIILKDEKPIYIITNTDLINYFLNNDDKLTIQSIIEKYPKIVISVNKNDDVYEAYKKMRRAGIEHLIVVDDEGKLVGEVYQKDLVMKFVEFALKDELTGLNNSRFLDTIIQRYNGSDIKIGVIFIDIDDFKHFNDEYGHKVGDEVIQFVAKNIKESIREVDFGFRYGGDEFIVMVFEQPKEIVLKIAKRIFDKITSQEYKTYGKVSR